MRAAIIGGGVAGLVTAKVLKQDGFDVTVFEREQGVGGVWAASRAYPGLRTNNPRETYAFSDFPHAETTDEFPTAEQVRAYLEAYVERFGLEPHLRLATEVVRVSRRRSDGGESLPGFRVSVRRAHAAVEEESAYFDFVVVCNGVFSEPYVPPISGAHRFGGSVIHSSRMPGTEQLKGKNLIVVGAGKSALDCATLAGRTGDSCTLLFRTPHWMLPRYFGPLRVDRVAFTRLFEMMLPAYHHVPREEAIVRWAAKPLLPLLWLLRIGMSRLVARVCGIPDVMVPKSPIHTGVENVGIGAELYEGVRQGLVRVRRASVAAFTGPGKVRLDTGEEIGADLVICATGWRQNVPFLSGDLSLQVRRNGLFQLYRNILPPAERRLGFVGYASSSASPLTSEVAAHWLSQCFRGELALPATAEMEHEIARIQRWAAAVFPSRKEGYFIGAYVSHYIDELMRDMGLNPRRCNGLVAEYLGPLWSQRYRGLAHERRAVASDSR